MRHKGRINLVSGTNDTSTSKSGVESIPAALTNSVKLDQLLGMVTTMNTQLDHQGQWLALVEAAIPVLAQACDITLPDGAGGVSDSDTNLGMIACSSAGGGEGANPMAGDNPNPGDGLDNCELEQLRNDGRGHGRTIGIVTREGRGTSGALGGGQFGRDRADDYGARWPENQLSLIRRGERSPAQVK
jgi:hypothetical protein